MTSALQDIPRHKTAIGRSTLSRPVKLALADGLIDPETPGNATTLFVWDGPNLVAMGSDSGVASDLRLIAGTEAAQRQALIDGLGNGPVWYLHPGSDLHSTLAVTDDNGKFAEGYAYSASGTPTFFDGQGNQATGSASKIDNRFLYQGQLYDSGLSLYAMGRRLYKPAWQRFISPDPLGTVDDPNLYSFVRGRVLTHWDPSGLSGKAQNNYYSTRRLIGPDKVADWTDDLDSGIGRASYDPVEMAKNRPPIDYRLPPNSNLKSLLSSYRDIDVRAVSGSQASDFYVVRDITGGELFRTPTGLAGTALSWFQPGDLGAAKLAGALTNVLGWGVSGFKSLATAGATELVEGAAPPVVGEVLESGATNVLAEGAGETGLVSRGPGVLRGIFSRTTNLAGGEVWTSSGGISQNEFASIVNSGLMKGEVNIITGVHGRATGEMIAYLSLYWADVARFGMYPGVRVFNVPSMTTVALSNVLKGAGTIIGAFCHSGACFAKFW
jgi:RHS repeat-associated protein